MTWMLWGRPIQTLAGLFGAYASAIPRLVPFETTNPLNSPAISWSRLHRGAQPQAGKSIFNGDWLRISGCQT